MVAKPYYLAIDQGGHACRAMVFDSTSEVRARSSCRLVLEQPQLGYAEYQPLALISALKQVINDVITELGTAAQSIVAAGLVTQRSNIACWDGQSGEALSPIISWQDLRNTAWIEGFSSQRDWIHHCTGLFANGHYGVSKLQWCWQHLPAVKQAQFSGRLAWGPMASYLLAQILRESRYVIDPANASRTLLMNIETLDWDAQLSALFQLPTVGLPQIVPSAYPYGYLDLPSWNIPLTVMNGDQSAALFAHGWPEQDTLYVNLGTGAFIQRLIDKPLVQAERLLNSVVWRDQQKTYYVLEGTVNGAACAVEEVLGQVGLTMAQFEQGIEEWLQRRHDVPLFMNGCSGIGSPYWRSDVSSYFIGEGSKEEKVVAVLESVLFLLMENIREMDKFISAAKQIIVSGGLSQIDGLCQSLASLSGIPVIRLPECEASAQGLAFLLSQPNDAWRGENGKRFIVLENNALNYRYKSWREALQNMLLL